jgi:hypothetical protein
MKTQFKSSRAVAPRAAIVAGACLAASGALAQEAIQGAEVVEESREARQRAIDRNLYNLKAGPVLMRFDAGMRVEFNDNPELLDDPPEVDFAFFPEFNIATLWALNPRNALALNLGIGYVKYVNTTELDHLVIAPNSELAFDIRTRDVVINFHERISHTQNPVNDPTVSGTGDFGGFENTVGTRVDWDLNDLVFAFGYDHYNFISTSDGVSETVRTGTGGGTRPMFDDVQDRSSEIFYGAAGIKLSPAVEAGLEAGGSLNDYCSDFFNDNTQFSVGPYTELQITRDLRARAAAGYVRSDFEDTGVVAAPDTVNDFYANIRLEHQLSQYMNHRLSFGREAVSGAASELVTLYFVRYENNWAINRLSTLQTALFYEDGEDESSIGEKFSRIGAAIGVAVPVTRKLTAGAGYQFLYKNSDAPLRDYVQNLVFIEARYAF